MKKKTAIVLSFTVGIMLFATTALAEIAAKSGYEQAKDTLKYTSDSITSKLSSHTIDISYALKDNGNIIMSQNQISKYDSAKGAQESTTIVINGKNKREILYYIDKNSSINFNTDEGIYYVNENNNSNDPFRMSDPFKEKTAGDVEKIIDALVGNLRDYVVVKQNSDGSKELSGSLSEAQIPALVNALVSYQFKRDLGINRDPNNLMPVITKDVFVKKAEVKMAVDKNGLVQSVLGTGTISGNDDKDKEHSLTFEFLGKLTNINSTVVKKPDLTGKKVDKNVNNTPNSISKPELYIGTYKNDIVIEKDNKLIKIGERILDITKIDNKTISGKYHESYEKGYEDYSYKINDFNFDAVFDQSKWNAEFDFVNSSGGSIKGYMNLHPDLINKIFFSPSTTNGKFDGQFNRIFE